MTPAEVAVLVGTARQLMAWSDQRDRELAARLDAERRAYAEGIAAGDHAGREAVHGWYAAMWGDVAAEVGAEAARAEAADRLRPWHVCCRPCRLGGCRPRCERCEDRTAETFGMPHPDDRLFPLREAA